MELVCSECDNTAFFIGIFPLVSLLMHSLHSVFISFRIPHSDVIGSRCDPYTHFLMTGEDYNHCCHSNLTRAATRDGLTEMDVHDVLNVFMCTGFTRDTNQYFTKPSPVEVGDYIEFLAETDLLVSASTCPQGDVSMACGGGGEPDVFPLGVEIYKLEDSFLEEGGWSPSDVSNYGGNHGII